MVNINGTTHAYAKPAESPSRLLLRTRFDSALVLLKPLLSDSDALMSGTSLYRAMSQLHKAYPDLRGDEIEALVSEVIRSLQNRDGKH